MKIVQLVTAEMDRTDETNALLHDALYETFHMVLCDVIREQADHDPR